MAPSRMNDLLKVRNLQHNFITVKKALLLCLFFIGTNVACPYDRLYVYTYDSAGNVISKKLFSATHQPQCQIADDYDSQPSQFVSINTDEGWSTVHIKITGEIMDGDMLYIYSSRGLLIQSIRLSQAEFTLNLSDLEKGIYIFCFQLSGEKKETKYHKNK